MYFYSCFAIISAAFLLYQKTELFVMLPFLLVFRFFDSKKLILITSVIVSCYFGYITRLVKIGNPKTQDFIDGIANNYDHFYSRFINNFLALLMTLAIVFVLVKAIKKLKLSHFWRLFVFVGISFFWLYVFSNYTKGHNINGVFLLSSVLFFKLFGLWLLIISYTDFEIKNIKDFLFMMPPIWDTAVTPRPEIKILESRKSQDVLDREAWRLTTLFTGFFIIALVLKTFFISNVFYDTTFDLLPTFQFDLSSILKSGETLTKQFSIFIIFLNGIFYLCAYLAWIILVDVCYRLFGFEPSRQFYYPFKAKTAGEFYSNVMPYYSHSLNVVALFPLYKNLRSLFGFKNFSYSSALFLSIFIYAYLYHVTIDINYFIEYDFITVLKKEFFSILPFSVVIFILIRFIKFPSSGYARYFKPLYLAAVIFNFGLLVIFRNQPMKVSIFEKLNFLKSLFF